MDAEAALTRIGEGLIEPTATDVAARIALLIRTGDLGAGQRLPTVRGLAAHLGIGPNTVAEAWRKLQAHGLIITDRRRGTTVRGRHAEGPGRYWQVPVAPGTIEIDLSTGTPDASLLPPLGPILHRLHTDVVVTSYIDGPVLPELETALRAQWPFEPEAVTVVDGALDALDRMVDALIGFGDVVIVEDPTFPPLLDMLDLAGARVIGVPLDDQGPLVDELAAAVAQGAIAAFFQPRAHNPTGVSMSATRAALLAEVLAESSTLVVEDDHSGSVSAAPDVSLGSTLTGRVAYIRSFSKSHGPDLRIAAIGGPADIVAAIVRRRRLGPSWTSRLTQRILVEMLGDPEVSGQVDRAAATYQARRRTLTDGLAEGGVTIAPGHGLNLWIPVRDEHSAVVSLAAHSIGVAPGAPFGVCASEEGHIRVSVGQATDQLERIAAKVAAAALGYGPTPLR